MKAIVLAAGRGTRLRPFTARLPKCMLSIGGLTIIERQTRAFRDNGIKDLVVVTGFMGSAVCAPGARIYSNPCYETTNVLYSLFAAAAELVGPVVVSYSDIVFHQPAVAGLLAAPGDIVLVTDPSWHWHYEGRTQHPIAEAEKVVTRDGRVIQIGKHLSKEADAEFIGLLKLSTRGSEVLRSVYGDLVARGLDRPLQQARAIRDAYITDLLQELIDRGHSVHTTPVRGRWAEIDTPQDLKRCSELLGSINATGQSP